VRKSRVFAGDEAENHPKEAGKRIQSIEVHCLTRKGK
jgi:hypothetical protein